jgi:hypothetical protein
VVWWPVDRGSPPNSRTVLANEDTRSTPALERQQWKLLHEKYLTAHYEVQSFISVCYGTAVLEYLAQRATWGLVFVAVNISVALSIGFPCSKRQGATIGATLIDMAENVAPTLT